MKFTSLASSPEYSRGWNECANAWDIDKTEALTRDTSDMPDDYAQGWTESLEYMASEWRERLEKIQQIKKEGYAGVDYCGSIVDRREFPNAVPMQKNSLLGIPEPKDV